MKTSIKLFALGMILMGFGVNVNAQVTNNEATATATIISPISIEKDVDMSFGNIAVSTALGTVTLNSGDARVSDGGITLPTTLPGTVTSASFTVTGAEDYTYTVTLPASATLTHTNATNTMLADSFTSNLALGIGTLTSGTSNLKVGATLHVAGSQLAGVYTSTGFAVTVNYN